MQLSQSPVHEAPTHVALRERTERPASPKSAWLDRVLGSDPGMGRLAHAAENAMAVAAGIGVMWLFVRWTGALQVSTRGLPAAQAAIAAARNHGMLLSAMATGGVASQLLSVAVSAGTIRQRAVRALDVPTVLLAGLALGMSVNAHRVLSLAMFVVVLAAGVFIRRFGPRANVLGVLCFVGYLMGDFLHGVLAWKDFGWLAAEAGIGACAGLVVHLAIFYPLHRGELRRYRRSYDAHARGVVRLALQVLDGSGERALRKLGRQALRLNKSALIIDSHLTAESRSLVHGFSPSQLHARVFDVELAVSNLARLVRAFSQLNPAPRQRVLVKRGLEAFVAGDDALARHMAAELASTVCVSDEADELINVVAHRLAGTFVDLADALGRWSTVGGAQTREEQDDEVFTARAQVIRGRLVGGAVLSSQASMVAGRGLTGRIRLKIADRTALQILVASTIALVAGDALSGRRFYWALMAVFVGFMGTSNSGEQIRKVCFRVAGTLVGVGISIGLVHLVGHSGSWALAIILMAWFLGFYVMELNYAFFIVFLVIALGQLYNQLGEWSNSLLWMRLAETALGAAAVILTMLVVAPLHPRRVLKLGLKQHLTALGTLVDHASRALVEPAARTGTGLALRGDVRALDAAHHTLMTTADPLRSNVFGQFDGQLGEVIGLVSTYRHNARLLVADLPANVGAAGTGLGAGPADTDRAVADFADAAQTLRTSIDQLVAHLDGEGGVTYVRSAGLFDRVERELAQAGKERNAAQLALRDLRKIDQALADLAGVMSVPVANYDTALVA